MFLDKSDPMYRIVDTNRRMNRGRVTACLNPRRRNSFGRGSDRSPIPLASACLQGYLPTHLRLTQTKLSQCTTSCKQHYKTQLYVRTQHRTQQLATGGSCYVEYLEGSCFHSMGSCASSATREQLYSILGAGPYVELVSYAFMLLFVLEF